MESPRAFEATSQAKDGAASDCMPPAHSLITASTLELFNDMYFSGPTPRPSSASNVFTLFPLLPTELRLRIWRFALHRRRMVELRITPAPTEDHRTYPGRAGENAYYTTRNGQGNVISGRGYTLSVEGGDYPDTLSPLLRVNSEARSATLAFYRVRLPFPGQGGERSLYLNPEYDVVYVRPGRQEWDPDYPTRPSPRSSTMLFDLLHDVRAYDPKDRGIIHLALHEEFLFDFLEDAPWRDNWPPPLTPEDVHPTAADSFIDILRSGRLQSVFCVIRLRGGMRGTGEPPGVGVPKYHFAHTLPLRRRDFAAGMLDWLDVDPRPGVEVDTTQIMPITDPREFVRSWEQLERAFGFSRKTPGFEDEGESTEESSSSSRDGGARSLVSQNFRLYICPSLDWPADQSDEEEPSPRRPRRHTKPFRTKLAEHLVQEQEDWDRNREFQSDFLAAAVGQEYQMPWQGTLIDAETHERLENAPSTTVGMWLFPAVAFCRAPKALNPVCFDVSNVRPGLFLFDV